MEIVEPEELKEAIVAALKRQGFRIRKGVVSLPKNPTKDVFRKMNELAVAKKREIAVKGLKRHEPDLIQYLANGNDVTPEAVHPKIVVVKPDTEHELLFRYACLHWSIPVSPGYGRRLRFLVFDESNDKLIGLFGLGDPVYSMRARDEWIGWDKAAKAQRLYHVMDAYVLGAVPPYSFLLGGKLIAMLVCSNEVRNAFRRKYHGHESIIRKETHPPYLALVTTTSALGRSSIYNRIRVNSQEYWTSVGFTQGYGEFHFCNGVYADIRAYVERYCEPTAKHEAWGSGFRNKREVIKKCLQEIGLSTDLLYHGIRREIFVAPLGRNALPFLRGDLSHPVLFNWPAHIQHGAIQSVSRDLFDLVRNYTPLGPEMYQLVQCFGNLSRRILQEGTVTKHGPDYYPSQTTRIEVEPTAPGQSTDEVAAAQQELMDELVRRTIFVEMEPGRSRHQFTTTLRWQLRRIYCPVFGTSIYKNTAVKWNPDEFKRFLLDPKTMCEVEFSKRWERGSCNEELVLFDDEGDYS